jgi:hypothetical protein
MSVRTSTNFLLAQAGSKTGVAIRSQTPEATKDEAASGKTVAVLHTDGFAPVRASLRRVFGDVCFSHSDEPRHAAPPSRLALASQVSSGGYKVIRLTLIERQANTLYIQSVFLVFGADGSLFAGRSRELAQLEPQLRHSPRPSYPAIEAKPADTKISRPKKAHKTGLSSFDNLPSYAGSDASGIPLAGRKGPARSAIESSAPTAPEAPLETTAAAGREPAKPEETAARPQATEPRPEEPAQDAATRLDSPEVDSGAQTAVRETRSEDTSFDPAPTASVQNQYSLEDYTAQLRQPSVDHTAPAASPPVANLDEKARRRDEYLRQAQNLWEQIQARTAEAQHRAEKAEEQEKKAAELEVAARWNERQAAQRAAQPEQAGELVAAMNAQRAQAREHIASAQELRAEGDGLLAESKALEDRMRDNQFWAADLDDQIQMLTPAA